MFRNINVMLTPEEAIGYDLSGSDPTDTPMSFKSTLSHTIVPQVTGWKTE